MARLSKNKLRSIFSKSAFHNYVKKGFLATTFLAASLQGASYVPPIDFNEGVQTEFSIDKTDPEITKEDKKAYLEDYYEIQLKHIDRFCKKYDLKVTPALLSILQDLKKGEFRKDNVTPEIAHQIDQMLPVMTSVEHGVLKGKVHHIERKHSSFDVWLGTKVGHDMCEDDFFFPDTLKAKILDTVAKLFPGRKSLKSDAAFLDDVSETVELIENLTFERKFTAEEFKKYTDIDIDLTQLTPGKPQSLGEDVINKIFDRIGRQNPGDDSTTVNPAVYVRWKKIEDRLEPHIIVTAFGSKCGTSSDWNAYIGKVEEHLLSIDTKGGDRVEGASTRIAVPEKMRSFINYISKTNYTTRTLGLFKRGQALSKTRSMKDFVGGQKQMTKMIHRLAEMVIHHAEENNVVGHKVCDAHSLSKGQFNLLYFSEFLPERDNLISKIFSFNKASYESALDVYEHVPDVSHPLIKFMGQLSSLIKDKKDYNLNKMFEVIVDNLRDHGGGSIAERIQKSPFMVHLRDQDFQEHIQSSAPAI